jgi:hypothetical protein
LKLLFWRVADSGAVEEWTVMTDGCAKCLRGRAAVGCFSPRIELSD